MDSARRLGFEVIEDDAMLISDFIGPTREVFITGTACGMMPVTHIDNHETAGPGSRPLMAQIQAEMRRRSTDDSISFCLDASEEELKSYLEKPHCF